ncbi:hypothetical protein ACJ5H2_13410 [Nocardioides sp. R1-1]|uniref:hypothetical protein n=1 Tax=Nocardioides sp. R1-1 TaxID=3383502 RepID=UPI0038CFC9CD
MPRHERSYRERLANLVNDSVSAVDSNQAYRIAVNALNELGDLIVECDDCGGGGFDGCDDCDMTGLRGSGKCRTCRGEARLACPTCSARGYVVNETAW